MNLIIRLFITAAVAYGLSIILKGVHIPNFTDALILAVVLALLNTFITNKNKPIVIMVMGKVRITKIGLINVFSSASTTARISASVKLGMCTPFKIMLKP